MDTNRLQTVKALLLTFASALIFVGCQGKSSGFSDLGIIRQSSDSQTLALGQDGTAQQVVAGYPDISGPQVTIKNVPNTYEITIPQDYQVQQMRWDFGDGTAPVIGLPLTQTHIFRSSGFFQIRVSILDQRSVITDLIYGVNVLATYDGPACIMSLGITLPSQATAGQSVPVALSVPSCLDGAFSDVNWSFGDSQTGSGLVTSHTYADAGDFTVTAIIPSSATATTPALQITKQIHILAAPVTPSPTPLPNPLACPSNGTTRVSYLDSTTESATCGNGGTKQVTSRVKIIETCQPSGDGSLLWTESSRTTEVVSEGQCLQQSCNLPDGSVIKDGESKTMYSSQTPVGSCADVSQVRTCANGQLSGASNFSFLTCSSGCGDFGINGTQKTVAIADVSVPLTCQYGETGYFSVYENLADQVCRSGEIVTTGTHQGSLKSQKACPTYQWAASENWTQCSADCGGTQSQIFVCMSNEGAVSSSDRCTSAAPVVTRLCDGNPAAVRKEIRDVTTEEGSSSTTCPKNQVGVITSERDVTTVFVYACINHQVGLESQQTTYGPWVTTSYCRNYTAHRCSQDSLSNTEAEGRYQWMLKCRDSVPVIKEFLDEFEDVKVNGYSIHDSKRHLYPTFMNHATVPEKPWIAPKKASASCSVPKTAYIATVCLSSCATPEQQILTHERKGNTQFKYLTFLDALNEDVPFAATLGANSTLKKFDLQKTKVDQWVTELVDTKHDILVFKMKSGRSLKLTPNHVILSEDGSMRLAETFKVGEPLVVADGSLDPIVSIDKEDYFGKVYNVFLHTAEPLKNIVVTNGYLNGSGYFQNEGEDQLNRQLLRKKLLRGVFNK